MSITYNLDSPVLWVLVLIQVSLGCFDIFYHHEFTERLPWRDTAKTELRLHAARNLFYAALFGMFAWWQPHGVFAMIAALIIIAEVFITLWDFVEEDKTRALPASERLTHTLLALNYGAIMVFVLPTLWHLSQQASQMMPASYGLYLVGNIILSISSLGCFLFALRDYAMSRRGISLYRQPASPLAKKLAHRHRIVITGGTGFVGSRLIEALTGAGHAVIVLTRSTQKAASLNPPFTIVTDLSQIPGHLPIDAIINLAGAPVAEKRWSPAYRKTIINSRLGVTWQVEKLISRLDHKPELLIGASAIGFYGLRGDEILHETDQGKPAFSHDVTEGIEMANEVAAGSHCRLVNMRIGIVLGYESGVLGKLLPIFDWALGGRTGSGQQWMSWIERDDLVRMIIHTIATPSITGVINAVAPDPVRNQEFARLFGKTLKRPAFLPLPSFVVNLLFGQMGRELLLSGQRVSCEKISQAGFHFEYPQLVDALVYAVGKGQKTGEKIKVTNHDAAPQKLAINPKYANIEPHI